MRISLILLVLTAACGSSTGGTGGGSGGGSGGGAGGAGGGAGGGSGELPVPCTPSGFMTAPTIVNLLPITGATSASEHQAYAKFIEKDGGRSVSLSLTVEGNASDGGPNVPVLTARVNGCVLEKSADVPGVGRGFSSNDAGVWQPTAGRFVTFEVLSPTGTLLYRNVIPTPQVLPKILSVTTPAGPTAKVDWTAIPDAGVSDAFVFGWKKLGGGMQSVGFSKVSPAAGTVNLTLSQAANLFELEVQAGSGISRVRISSDFDVP